METTLMGLGFRVMLGLYSRPSNVVPFWVWYVFGLELLLGLPKKCYIGGSRKTGLHGSL